MIARPAVVIAVNDGDESIWVRIHNDTAVCSSCTNSQGCNSAQLFAKLFRKNNDADIKIASSLPLKVGDKVFVGIKESQLLRFSLLIYLMPLCCLILAALIVQISGNNDFLAISAGFTGLIVSFIGLKRFGNNRFHNDLIILRHPDNNDRMPEAA